MSIYGPKRPASRCATPRLITVWAEERGGLRKGNYEWGFGDGAGGRHCGYTLTMPGRILRMGLCSATRTGAATDEVRVNVTVNGRGTPAGITLPAGQRSAYTIIERPFEVKAGSVINFITKSTNANISASIVTLIIELDGG